MLNPPASSAASRPAVSGGDVPTSTRMTLLLVASLTVMSGAIISPALPAIHDYFSGVPNADVLTRLVLTILGLAITLSAPVSGWLCDRFGRRPVLIAALALYGVAGASGLVAPTLWSLLAGRVVLGLAVGATMTAGAALVADLFSGAARTQFLGVQSAFSSLGGAVLLPLGGVLAAVSWRAPFAVYLVALLLLPLAWRLPHSKVAPAIQKGPAWKIPPSIWAMYAVAAVYMTVFYLMPVQLPFRLHDLKVPPSLVGLVLGAVTLAGGLSALSLTRWGARVASPLRLAGAGMLLQGAGWVLVGLADHLPLLISGLLLGGAGGGLVLPLVASRLGLLAPPAVRGRVMSGMTSAIFLGQFLSPVLAQPLVNASGVKLAFLGGAALALLVGLALVTWGRERAPGVPETAGR
ncbi:MFS transporter [Deinococcus altitudinis]|uniref:MFS transporter n=1 Tax=Deinococcus altitudinis TaxID=468914 RepID=UPI0038920A4D